MNAQMKVIEQAAELTRDRALLDLWSSQTSAADSVSMSRCS
jgi:hypothetical protein